MKVLESNGTIKFANNIKVTDKLDNGVYSVAFSQMEGYFLQKQPNFALPKKIYGDMSIAKRWSHSFANNSEKNMGVLLSGLKGGGKTVLAKKFCIDRQRPTILITDNYGGDAFIKFIANPLLNESTIFIDEFEKIYPKHEDQIQFLTLMDGVFETRLVFLLTTNQPTLHDVFFNRLNRIKYHKQFSDLDPKTTNEIIDDLLENKDNKQGLIDLLEAIQVQSYDILISIIKEMNLFNESAISCAAHLNLKQETVPFSCEEVWKGKKHYIGQFNVSNRSKNRIDVYRNVHEYKPKPRCNSNLGHDYMTIELAKCERKDIVGGFEAKTPEGLIFQFTRFRDKPPAFLVDSSEPEDEISASPEERARQV